MTLAFHLRRYSGRRLIPLPTSLLDISGKYNLLLACFLGRKPTSRASLRLDKLGDKVIKFEKDAAAAKSAAG